MASKRLSAVCFATACLTASIAHADGPSARATYQRGKVAYDSGDYAQAARAFAEADSITPNDIVLEFAIASALRAGDPVLGMELVERAEARGLSETSRAGRAAFEKQVGLAIVICPSECSAAIDGTPVPTGKTKWLRVGDHDATIEIGGAVQHVPVRVISGETVEVRPARPTPPPNQAALVMAPVRPLRQERSPSPVWFWSGAVTTALLGGATIVSGLDAAAINDRWKETRSDAALADRGQSAEMRTNILLIGTGVAAVVTATLGYFVFRSQPGEARHASR